MKGKKRRPKKFLVELIKPSHYDDQGYVIQWWRGFIPSNSLSCMYGLALEVSERRALGPDIDIDIEVRDETNVFISTKKIVARFVEHGNCGLVCLVGVQTNQFARAMDIARELRAAGIQVAVGGFHVSGCVAMLPELTPELKEAVELGITLFAGEAEGRLEDIFRAAYENRLQPVYNFMKEMPDLGSRPLPFLPERYVARYAGKLGCFDAGRGCPYACSFCSIINVQGRKSRFRTADDVEQMIRAGWQQGVKSYFITDDDFARNRNWEAILDRIIALRLKEKLRINIIMQVDTLSYKIPNFVKKAAAAGCRKVFIGLENINPESLKGASKGQNHISEYRLMLQTWRKARVLTYAGYILGFPADTPESIAHDIAIIQRELPIDIMEFFILTPGPGSQDHQELYLRGVPMSPDTNQYDSEHAVTAHPRMTAEQWQDIYKRAWHLYYTPAHIETILRRAAATGLNPGRVASMIFYFYASHAFEGVHPLQSGVFRRKRRSQRRAGFPRESALVFYPRRAKEVINTYVPALLYMAWLELLRWRIRRDPDRTNYTDLAITPAAQDDKSLFELYRRESGRVSA